MVKKGISLFIIVMMIGLLAVVVIAQDDETVESPLMDDFETEELFGEVDQFNNAIGHVAWGDAAGNVELSLAEIERDGAMTTALEINYDIGAWGGFTHALTDGENWVSQDWTAFNALQFSFYGSNTGEQIQVEIFDNRNADLNSDTAERWFFRITDDFEGWQEFTIPFDSFQRRSDFQPGGAPNDGLGLDAVSGYAFGFPAGVGAQTVYLDNVTVLNAGVEPIIIDDFEQDALFIGQDANGVDIGYIPWGDVLASGELNLIDAVRGSDDTRALAVNYDVLTFGGFSHVFTDGESWTPQDWTSHNAIEFWFLGSNTGEEIQFEIFDNLNPDANGDSAERWFYRFVDDDFGWKLVQIPFIEFQRRSDWQPSGALDDGFNLNAVSGYAFSMPVGTGSKVAVIDDVQVIVLDGVEMPEGVAGASSEADTDEPEITLEPVTLPPVEPNPEFLGEMEFAEPMLVADYESGVAAQFTDNVGHGFFTWGDTLANTIIGVTQIQALTDLSLPDQADTTQIFRIEYDIDGWGGFTHLLSDGEAFAPQDWTSYNAIQFWLYGNDTGQVIEFEIFDNMNPDVEGDTAERFVYRLVDDYDGWQQYTIPFAFFQRSDVQPNDAPDDGFNLDAVTGYGFGFPAGVGSQIAYIEDMQVLVVEDPANVRINGDVPPVTSIEIDDSITWDSREWDLLWSDEFDAEAGTPINDDYWTCEVGRTGWGNNELQDYTTSNDNAAHDG
ncbi:MAG: carbohydrate binding domain-containing protein, partial [Chloroflexota bacterium]